MIVVGIGYEPILQNLKPVTAWCKPSDFVIAKRIRVDFLAHRNRFRDNSYAGHSTAMRIAVDALSDGAYQP